MKIAISIIILHAQKDRSVPSDMSQQLYVMKLCADFGLLATVPSPSVCFDI
jgi:hypothetical protein